MKCRFTIIKNKWTLTFSPEAIIFSFLGVIMIGDFHSRFAVCPQDQNIAAKFHKQKETINFVFNNFSSKILVGKTVSTYMATTVMETNF